MTSQLPRFWCLFLSCQQQKNTANGTVVTSLRSSLLRDDFKYISKQRSLCMMSLDIREKLLQEFHCMNSSSIQYARQYNPFLI